MINHKIIPLILSLSIVSLSFGGLGGSFQPSRLFLFLIFPFFFVRIINVFFSSEIVNVKGIRFSSLTFAVATLIFCFFSIFWSYDFSDSLSFMLVLIINLIPIFFIFVINDKELKTFKTYLPRAWLIAAVTVSIFACYELITQNHFPGSLQERGGGDFVNALPYAAGFHGNYNDFSLFLFFCVTGMLLKNDQADTNDSKGTVLLKWSLVFFIFFVILVNGSRAAIISVSFLLLYYFIRSVGFKFFYYLIPFLAIFYLFFQSARDYFTLIYLFLEFKFTDFSNDLSSDEGRLALINAGIKAVFETYGAGVGAGASTAFLSRNSIVSIPNPHNLILEWILNFGILGFSVFILFFLKIIVNTANKSLGRSRFLIQAIVVTLPIWGVIQSHLIGFTYFWLALFTIIVFLLRTTEFSDVK